MRAILESHPGLARVVADASHYRLQAVLGLVQQMSEGPRLVQHGFRLGAEYFYPASTVKLFAAVAALEWLSELRQDSGYPIDAATPLFYYPLFSGEVLEDTDPTNLDGGTITVGHEIRKLFLVSDNEAFNRLYELVGQDGLAASLRRAGLEQARIVHRLSEARSARENREAPRIDFMGEGWRYTVPRRTSSPLPPPPPLPGLRVGTAHVVDGREVPGPLHFAEKNRIALATLQRGLCMVVRPKVECGGAGFTLSPADRDLLLLAMRQVPRESRNPVYDPSEYPDDYVKFLLPGLARVIPRQRLEVYGKSGQAYGFTTVNAYIRDTSSGDSFYLAATLYTNADGVVNDDRYEYQEVALPFLADLGEATVRRVSR